MNNVHYYLAFSHFMGIGPMLFDKLVDYFGSVENAYNADKNKLEKVMGAKLLQDFIHFRNTFDVQKKLEECSKKRIIVLSREHEKYPVMLKDLSDAPICLYARGDISAYDFAQEYCIAIVGTRDPTSYGYYIASQFSYELAKAGVIVVSGMANGIDGTAHMAALKAKGKTIAVLGSGVDVPYPRNNRLLYEQIIESGGLVISEFPPGMYPLKGTFVARNRIVSGLSQGVFVVEGMKDSGSLITARCAADQGREVFAPPVPLTSTLSEAPNTLIKQGAKLVTEVSDILEELGMHFVHKSDIKRKSIPNNLSSDEETIYKKLSREAFFADDLSRETQFSIEKVLMTISCLELKGLVEKNTEGKYALML